MNAWEKLNAELGPGETIEAIVIGAWEGVYHKEPEPPIPPDKRGVLLSPEEAKPLMQSWAFGGGWRGPSCYACIAWTTLRVAKVFDCEEGGVLLLWSPRNPVALTPVMY